MSLLYFGKLLWWVYVQTPVGQQYLHLFTQDAIATAGFYGRDLIQLALRINWFVLEAALVFGMISQALFLTSESYNNLDGFKRFLFWTVPFAAVCAAYLHRTLALDELTSFILVSLAAAFLLDFCMRITSRLLPAGLFVKGLYRFFAGCRCLLLGCD
jgi:hypothetical protein